MACNTNIPTSFRITNFDQEPTKIVEMDWDQVTPTTLQALVMDTNDVNYETNDECSVTAHDWEADSIEVHRGTTVDFTPGPGTLLQVLAASAVDYDDTTFSLDQRHYWKIHTQVKRQSPADIDWSTSLPAAMDQPPALANSGQIVFTTSTTLRSYDTADGNATSGFSTTVYSGTYLACPVCIGQKADTEGDIIGPMSYYTGSWWAQCVRADTGASMGSWQYGAWGHIICCDYGGPTGGTAAGFCGFSSRSGSSISDPSGFHWKYDTSFTASSTSGSVPYAGADMQGSSGSMVYDSSASRWMMSSMMGQYLRRGDCDAYPTHPAYAGSTYGWTVQIAAGQLMSKYLAHLSGKDFIVGGDDGKVYRRAFSNGAAVWDTSSNLTGDFSGYRGASVDGSDNIYISNTAGKVYKLNSSGVKQWETSNLGTMSGVPIITDNSLILVVSGTYLIALNAATGSTAWTKDIGGTGALQGHKMLMDTSGKLYVFQATDNKLHRISIDGVTGTSGTWPQLMKDGKHSATLT